MWTTGDMFSVFLLKDLAEKSKTVNDDSEVEFRGH